MKRKAAARDEAPDGDDAPDEAFDEDDNIEPGSRPSRSRNPTPRFAPMFTFHTVQDQEEEITAPRANDSLCELAYKAFAATEAIANDVSTPPIKYGEITNLF